MERVYSYNTGARTGLMVLKCLSSCTQHHVNPGVTELNWTAITFCQASSYNPGARAGQQITGWDGTYVHVDKGIADAVFNGQRSPTQARLTTNWTTGWPLNALLRYATTRHQRVPI